MVLAHRVVLAACSEYFAAMFSGKMIESNAQEVTLKELKGNILLGIINYCYTGCIVITEENVEDLVVAASLLQFEDIVSACWAFLESQLDTSNCLGLAFFAERHNCKSLQNFIEEYICINFSEVCKQEEFLQLNVENLGKLLEREDLNVRSEEDVFNFLMLWYNHDPENRKKHMPELLGLLRYSLLSPAFIMEHVQPICEQSDCEKLVMRALKWQLAPSQRTVFTLQHTKPRNSTLNVIIALGGADQTFGNIIERYCPLSDKWSVWNVLPERITNFSAALLDYKLVIFGGINARGQTINSTISLDLYSLAWSKLNSMLTERSKFGSVVHTNFIYIAGGVSKNEEMLQSVERFDSHTRKWYSLTSMPETRVNPGMAALNNLVYVVGGRTQNNTVLSSMIRYDHTTNMWYNCTPMITRRTSVAVAAVGEYIYAFGGCTDCRDFKRVTSGVERYDPRTNSWEQMKNMSIARCGLSCTILGDCVLVVGGRNEHGSALNIVEMYDTNINEWITNLSNCIYNRSGSCVVGVPNVIPATLPISDDIAK